MRLAVSGLRVATGLAKLRGGLAIAREWSKGFLHGRDSLSEGTPLFSSRRTTFKGGEIGAHDSCAAYRGDKITARVWKEILEGDYVAQAIAVPLERII